MTEKASEAGTTSVTRRRQIVRRAVIGFAGAVLILSAYVGGYVGMFWLLGRGAISLPTVTKLQTTVFEPIRFYSQHELPGSDFTGDACSWAHLRGSGNPISWSEFRNRPRQ